MIIIKPISHTPTIFKDVKVGDVFVYFDGVPHSFLKTGEDSAFDLETNQLFHSPNIITPSARISKVFKGELILR